MRFLHAVLLLIAVTSMLVVSFQNAGASIGTPPPPVSEWSRWEADVVVCCANPPCGGPPPRDCDPTNTLPDGTVNPCQCGVDFYVCNDQLHCVFDNAKWLRVCQPRQCNPFDPCKDEVAPGVYDRPCGTTGVCSPQGRCVNDATITGQICNDRRTPLVCVNPGDTNIYATLCEDVPPICDSTTPCSGCNQGQICIGGSCVPDEDGQCPPCPPCVSYLANPGDTECTLYDDANPLPVDKISCNKDMDCSSPKPYCELPDGVCVACRDRDDCPSGEVCVNGECTTECPPPCNDPHKPACLHLNNNPDVCVQCSAHSHCQDNTKAFYDPSKPVCKTEGNLPLNVCVQCFENSHCQDNTKAFYDPSKPVCKTSGNACLNVCVECVDDTKCGNCKACTNNICVDSSGSEACAPDNTKCGVCYAPPVCGASPQCDRKTPGTFVNGGVCDNSCIFIVSPCPSCHPPGECLPKGDSSEFGDDCLAGSTACCCDDVLDIHNEENKRERETDCNIGCSTDPNANDWPGFRSDSDDKACCSNAAAAVYAGRCYPPGRTHDIDGTPLFVSAGKWYDCDSHNSCACRRVKSGEADVGEYEDTIEMECCGDDPGEHYIAIRKDTPTINAACCNDRTDCVDSDGSCVSHGVLSSIPSVYPDVDCFCIAGAWSCIGEICTLDTAAHSREIDSMTCQP